MPYSYENDSTSIYCERGKGYHAETDRNVMNVTEKILNDGVGQTQSFIANNTKANTNKCLRWMENRIIKVSAHGQAELFPNVFNFHVKLSNTKKNVQDVKSSVTRRLDYVIYVIKSHKLKVVCYAHIVSLLCCNPCDIMDCSI